MPPHWQPSQQQLRGDERVFETLAVVDLTAPWARSSWNCWPCALPVKKYKFSRRAARPKGPSSPAGTTRSKSCARRVRRRRPGDRQHPGEVARDLPPGRSRAGLRQWSMRAATRAWTRGAACRARSESRGHCRPSGHHRQSQLFDHANGRGAETAARRRPRAAASSSAPIRRPASPGCPAARAGRGTRAAARQPGL